jgi:SAM-dependent methyltransferase
MNDGWVPETRFGTWFIRSDMWIHHVLAISMVELARLLGPHGRIPRIVDIGCGEGFALPMLADRFNPDRLIGIDVDPRVVARGAAMARRCACDAQIQIGDAAHLDLPDASADMVFCHQTLHHLSEQVAATREFFRILAPGGVLLLAESCRSFINSLWVRLLFRHPMGVQKSADEYLDLLRAVGFTFAARNVSTPYPPWSRPDLGLFELLGRPVPTEHREPLVYVAAFRPR